MKKAITAGRLRALPLHLSADCCDFVNSMLEPNASKRPSAAALLAHPFVARNLGGPIPKAPTHGPPRTLSTRGDSVSSTMDSFWSSQALISKQASLASQRNSGIMSDLGLLPESLWGPLRCPG